MKSVRTFLIFKIFTAIIFLQMTGCYTVIYNPEMEYSEENNYSEESYYGPGGIVIIDYYTVPWWSGMPVTVNEPNFRDDNIKILRGNGGGRNQPPGRDPINLPPPTRTKDDPGSQNTGSNETHTKKENKDDNSRNETRTKNDDSNQKNSIRNNDGSRNNDKKRK